MAYYANGQGPYRPSDHGRGTAPAAPSSTTSAVSLPYPVQQDPAMRRIPSFELGDDGQSAGTRHDHSALPEMATAQRHPVPQHGPWPGRQAGDGLGGRPSPSLSQATPPSPYGSALSGYRHQYQPQASPGAPSAYNPQLFAHVQSSYIQAPQSNVAGVHSPGLPPYNPAVYGSQVAQDPSMLSRLSSGHRQHSSPAGTGQGLIRSASGQVAEASTAQQLGRFSSQYRPSTQPGFPSSPNPGNLTYRPSAYSPPAPPPPPIPPGLATLSSVNHGNPVSRLQSLRGHSLPATYTQSSQSNPRGPAPHEPSPPADFDDRGDMHASNEPVTRPPPQSRHDSFHPLPSPPGSTSFQQRGGPSRHPQARPLPGPPLESGATEMGETGLTEEELAQESIWREVEAAVLSSESRTSVTPRLSQAENYDRQDAGKEGHQPEPLFSRSRGNSPDSRSVARTNGHLTSTGTGQYVNYDAYDDDSDAEAAAGLAAMQMADEQEAANEARRESGRAPMLGTYPSQGRLPRDDTTENSSDSDYANVDMDSYGGGYEGHMSYANGHFSELEEHGVSLPPSHHSRGSGAQASFPRSQERSRGNDTSLLNEDSAHPFPAIRSIARVDTFGTGGLAEPGARSRKLSFDNGDETGWDSQSDHRSGSQSPSKDEFPEMFYHPGMHLSGTDRPLPPVPSSSSNGLPQLKTSAIHQSSIRYQTPYEQATRAVAIDQLSAQTIGPTGLAVPRSTSLSSHSSTPQTVPPVRSKTDAEERKARALKNQQLGIYSTAFGSEVSLDTASTQGTVTLDLPAIPAGRRKRFNPFKLSTSDFRRCQEPWALSSIAAWVKDMSEDESDLKETTVIDGIVALFTHKVPTMNIADAETLGLRVVQEMFAAGALIRDEEWVKFGSEIVAGVIWQLTGSGCYAPRLHSQEMPGRCYAHHCSRTLKKINLQTQVLEPQRKLEDWATFYKVKKEDIEYAAKKEVERQNILHEIVQTEDLFMDQLNVVLVLYRDQLVACQPPILQPSRVGRFATDVFGKVDAVKKVNEDFLLAQLKYRQQEQGPWIIGFSDIFREWIRKAKHAYIEYAANFPHASLMVRKEAERNILFRQFLDQVRENERSKRLGWDTYLKAPITRLQHYSLLLTTVLKNTVQETEEKANLQTAIDEIKVVTLECDTRVAEMSKKVELTELSSKLILRPGLQCEELNLDHLGRELVFEGDLQRTGANRFNWLEIHAMLFDHYLVLAKTIHQKGSTSGVKHERYDVSKRPISMDLLVLESTNDDPVVKSSVKGIGAVTTVTTKAQPVGEPRHTRSNSNQGPGPGTLTQTSTSTSIASTGTTLSGKTMVTSTVLEAPRDEKVMYPFRIKHLGRDMYTLYAPSAQTRQDWCDKILEAKTKHAASLFSQNAEPFRLRVIADTAFAYDALAGGPKGTVIKGTPLDRAVREVEKTFENAGARPGPICRAAVNCATAFLQPYGKEMLAVGTDFGVFISEANNPRGWYRAISILRVTQIAVLEEFSLFLLIADKSFIAYHLDIVCPVSGLPPRNDSLTKAPQKLSGNREVGFFATGRMKERTLVFYKKREGLSSTFKVLEPVFHKATEKKPRFSRKGTTEFFREFDEFYIPAECFGINVFRSYLANSTARGFEVLNLEKKQPYSVPDLKQPHVASIAARLSSQKPLGMFRLNDTEFLLCYDECAVYVNKHGDVSRSVVMEYLDKARGAAIYGPYVLLFDTDFIEIRNAENGRLRQVIPGRDIKCLDDAQTGSSAGQRTIKITLQHPEMERTQLVLELILNEGQRD